MDAQPVNLIFFSLIVMFNIIVWMVMIASIGVGAMHFGSCPVQPYIPFFLVVLGLSTILSLSMRYLLCSQPEETRYVWTKVCVAILHVFTFCWFISGTVWIYGVYPPSYKIGDDGYCHKTLYQFAFFFTSLCWLFVCVMFCYVTFYLVMTCRRMHFQRTLAGRLVPGMSTSYGGINENSEAEVQ